ncbi:hypothetical protein ABPG75_000313 [Micractinium tetrahymenae]
MTGILAQAWAQPATYTLVAALLAIWWQLRVRCLGSSAVGMSYDAVVRQRAFWRCITATISHIELWHLACNAFSLLSYGVMEARLGSVCFLHLTALIALLAAPGSPATPASDAFSFGVVLWELLTWQLPWHTDGVADSHWQIVAKLTVGERLSAPPPEQLPGSHRLPPELYQQYLQLMQDCWAADLAARPTFAAIATRLRELIRALIAPTGAALPPTPKSVSPMTPVDRPF